MESGAISRPLRPGRSDRIHSVIELSEFQLRQVAKHVNPEDWTDLGLRLGFLYPEIQRLKEQHKNILDGIYMMLVEWLKFQCDINKTEARKCLSDAFRAIGREDLAGFLKNTAEFFLPPHNAVGDHSFVEFKYNVRSFKPEKDISFQCSIRGNNRHISRSALIEGAREKKEFHDRLCWCVHLLGVRLRRIEIVKDSPLIFTATAMDEDGVRSFFNMLRDSSAFEDELKKIVSVYTPHCQAEDINITLSIHNRQELEESINFFQKAEYSISGAASPLISDIELVTLAKELPPDSLFDVGLRIGFRDNEIENFKRQNHKIRGVYEEMLFNWKQRCHPCMKNRATLAQSLESANLRNLAEKIEDGAFRERPNEAERRCYLKRFSAPCTSVEPLPPPPSPVDHSDVFPASSTFNQVPEPAPLSLTRNDKPGISFGEPTSPASPRCHPPAPKNPPGPEDNISHYEKLADAITGSEEHQYQNLPYRREEEPRRTFEEPMVPYEKLADAITGSEKHQYQNLPYRREEEPRRTFEEHMVPYEKLAGAITGSEKHQYQNLPYRREEKPRRTFEEPMVPSIHDLELSVLDPLWQDLASEKVTQEDINTAHGLRKLAVALDRLSQCEIADTIWAALIKHHIQLMYMRTLVTGGVDLRACVINRKQESNGASLEDLTQRTEEPQFPKRIFIQANAEEDRDLVAMKLGYDWASENDSKKPLGNVDLLFMLRVEEIPSGSTVGEAILHQCLDCNSEWIESRRVENFLENANTKVIIVLKCDDESLARHVSCDFSTEERYQRRGLRELVLGEYLPNCIVILTTGPQVVEIRNYAHYMMSSSSSTC